MVHNTCSDVAGFGKVMECGLNEYYRGTEGAKEPSRRFSELEDLRLFNDAVSTNSMEQIPSRKADSRSGKKVKVKLSLCFQLSTTP
jgi:hypothetical protein